MLAEGITKQAHKEMLFKSVEASGFEGIAKYLRATLLLAFGREFSDRKISSRWRIKANVNTKRVASTCPNGNRQWSQPYAEIETRMLNWFRSGRDGTAKVLLVWQWFDFEVKSSKNKNSFRIHLSSKVGFALWLRDERESSSAARFNHLQSKAVQRKEFQIHTFSHFARAHRPISRLAAVIFFHEFFRTNNVHIWIDKGNLNFYRRSRCYLNFFRGRTVGRGRGGCFLSKQNFL